MDHTDVIPQTYLNGEVISVVDSDKHLGNYISTNITDRILLTIFVIYIREVIESLAISEYAIVMH